jgi:hypothetical protein
MSSRTKLELAIKRIRLGKPHIVKVGTKLSIASVAREAEMSNSAIHNRYPDIANSIRELVAGLSSESSPVESRSKKEYKKMSDFLHKKIKKLNDDLDKSQSVNLRLKKENDMLRAKLGPDAN